MNKSNDVWPVRLVMFIITVFLFGLVILLACARGG